MVRHRRYAVAVSLVVAFAVAGCGGDDDKDKGGADKADTSETADLKRFVITTDDLPAGYEREESKTSSSPDTCLTIENNPAAEAKMKQKFTELGFKACSGASFKKQIDNGVTKTNRPAGFAILMKDDDAASDALPALREGLIASFHTTGTATGFAPHSVDAPAIGDEAPRGLRLSGTLGALGDATFYIYVWRRDNVVAWLGSADFLGDFDQAKTLDLAKKVDARAAG